MRLTEFWSRMERKLGMIYARSFASDMVLAELESRTVEQALAEGDDVKSIWRAVCAHLDTPHH